MGNTHPGATSPLGMVSACAYSGAYPTGYGRYAKNTEGVPEEMFDRLQASGFTHFQQSGTGAIRKYYNYVRVTPMVQPLDDARAGLAAARRGGRGRATTRPRSDTGVRCEITVGTKVAVHRYTFPEHRSARVVVDLSCGGLAIELGRTVPLRAQVESMGQGRAQGTVVMEGVPLSVYLEVDSPGWRQMLWYDRRLIDGGTRLDFDSIRHTTLRPFGLLFMGPADGRGRPSRCGSGSRCAACEQARREPVRASAAQAQPAFDARPGADPGPVGATTSTGSRSRAARRPGARCSRRRSTTR